MLLPVTLTIAGAAALLHIWLSLRVSQVRRRQGVLVGDGGHRGLSARMRAHANFAENAPIALILLALTELAGANAVFLWACGIAFVLARIAHAFGMDRGDANALRIGGVAVSWLVIVALAGHALYLPYTVVAAPGEVPAIPVARV